MKKILLGFLIYLCTFYVYSKGSLDDTPLTEEDISLIKTSIKKNTKVEFVESISFSGKNKYCDFYIELIDKGKIYFKHYKYISESDEKLLRIGDYLIIKWYPLACKMQSNTITYRLITGHSTFNDIKKILNLSKNLNLDYLIENYNLVYSFIEDFPDCPFDLSFEEFSICENEPFNLPESWFEYNSKYFFEENGIPFKLFKLKVNDFYSFAAVQSFDKWKIKQWSYCLE